MPVAVLAPVAGLALTAMHELTCNKRFCSLYLIECDELCM